MVAIPVGTIDWEVWQRALAHDPALIAARAYGEDLSLLRANLALTPDERLRANDEALAALNELQKNLRPDPSGATT